MPPRQTIFQVPPRTNQVALQGGCYNDRGCAVGRSATAVMGARFNYIAVAVAVVVSHRVRDQPSSRCALSEVVVTGVGHYV